MTPAEEAEWLAFLSEQRMTLFNTRRDHEWKVVFGVLTLIGALDIALLAHPSTFIALKESWRVLLVLIFVGHASYQFGVQRRNRIDRIVIDTLNKRICDLVALDEKSLARIPVDRTSRRDLHNAPAALLHPTYLWAYYWQMLIVLVGCAVSWTLPLVAVDEQHKPCTVSRAPTAVAPA